MSKHHKIEISIPKPCSEDWDKMTLDEQGKFCSHCNKTVIDFSNFTDKELATFFSKTKEKVCGNFYSTQLNRLIAIQEQSNAPFFHKVLLGASLAAGVATSVSGQNSPATNNTVQQVQAKSQDRLKTVHDTVGGDTLHIISGVVIDTNNKQPVPFVNVMIVENGIVIKKVVSSGDGSFSIEIDSSLIGKTVILTATAINYHNTPVQIQIDKLPIKNITLPMDYFEPRLMYRGGAESQTLYIVDDIKVKKDTTAPEQSPDGYKKELIDKHLGTPASEEGSSRTH